MAKNSVWKPRGERNSKSRQAIDMLSLVEKRQQRIDELKNKAAELKDQLTSWSGDTYLSSTPLRGGANLWTTARNAYLACAEGGVSVSDYARIIDLRLSNNTPNGSKVSQWVQACRFIDYICKNSSSPELRNLNTLISKKGLFRSVDRVREFMYLDREEWVWIAEFYSVYHSQISAKKRSALVKTVKDAKNIFSKDEEHMCWAIHRETVALRCIANEPEKHI